MDRGLKRLFALGAAFVGTCGVVWCAVGAANAGGQQGFRYHYVSLDAAVPNGYYPLFDLPSITDSGRVYGTIYGVDPGTFASAVAVYDHGTVSIVHEGFAGTANNRGVAGGGVPFDPVLGSTQAALFVGSRVKLVPPVNGAFLQFVRLLTDSGIAFIEWYPEDFSTVSHYLLTRARVTPLDFGPDSADLFDINDRGVISGTSFRASGNRAFRYYPSSGAMAVLEPRSTERASSGQAINSRGDVLGYSLNSSPPDRQRAIGVWRGTTFQTYFVEDTPDVPSRSSHLEWNERGLIVSSQSLNNLGSDLNSYLHPRPGLRLKLADLVVDGVLPAWTIIMDLNSNGDMVGSGGSSPFVIGTSFLLERIGGDGEPASDALASVASRSMAAAIRSLPLRPPAVTRLMIQMHDLVGLGRATNGPERSAD